MPQDSLSLSSLCAVAATSVLAAGAAHILITGSDKGKNVNWKPRSRRSRRSRRYQDSSSDESSDSSDADVPPPPKPVAGRHHRKKEQKSIINKIDSGEGGTEWGFSMEDARAHAEQIASAKSLRTPREVLEDLQKGNARFWTGAASRPELSAFERRALIKQQFPDVAILSCSDSRVPTEIVFDQGLGDMFVIRVAGNALDNASHASLQYAVMALKVKVVVVMGHEGCGAVKHAMDPQDAIDKFPKQLAQTLGVIKANLDETTLFSLSDMKARDREAVVSNVKSQVEELTRDNAVIKAVTDHKLLIVGCFYEISSGIVDFFHEVSDLQEEPEASPANLDKPMRLPSRGVQSRYDIKTHDVTLNLKDVKRQHSPGRSQ